MKVALIIERSDVFLGGAERSVFELSSQLAAQGLDVALLAAKGQQHTKHVHVLCDSHPAARTPLNIFAQACVEHFKQNKYDIIHSVLPFDFADIYQPRGGAYPEAVRQNAVSYDSSFVEMFKSATSFFNFRRLALARAEARLCKRSDGPVIAALSNYVARQFKNIYNVPDDRIAIIPNGVKTDRTPDLAEFAEVRNSILQEYPPEADSPVFFLFAANNFRLKGLYQLIKALDVARVNPACKPFHLFVAGSSRVEAPQRLARSLDVDDAVTFLGSVSHIQNALALSDAAILPTFYDPASRFILEALAMAKPVITTAYNGSTDLFTDARHGIVIDDPRNIEALADAIVHFSDMTNINAATNAITADNVKEMVSIRRHVKQLIELYELILKRKSQ